MTTPLPPWVFVQEQVRADVRAKVATAYAEHVAGKLPRPELVARLVVLLKVTVEAATSLADKFTVVQMEDIDGQRRETTGQFVTWLPEAEGELVDELQAAFSAPDVAEALMVAGSAVTLAHMQEARQAALKDQGAEFWVRGVEADACEICTDLATGILPMSQAPWFHKGCGCSQEPIEPGKEY